MLRAENYTKERAAALVRACFTDLAKEADRGLPFVTGWPDFELGEQRSLAQECVSSLRAQIEMSTFDPAIEGWARARLQERGVVFDGLSSSAGIDLVSGYLRAVVEQQRLFMARLSDRLIPYVPADPLFANPAAAAGSIQAISALEPHCAPGPSLGDLVAFYLEAKRKAWTPKTHRTNTAKVRLLVEYFGSDRPVQSLHGSDVRRFRDAVGLLHKRHHTQRGASFAERQTTIAALRVNPKTAALLFESAKAVFRWAVSDAHIAKNPSEGIRCEVVKKSKATRVKRRPFTAVELEKLFGSPAFSGYQSKGKRYEPGPILPNDARFWIPVLGYYTGARLGELVQLHLTDVSCESEIPYIDITEDNSGDCPDTDFKHVKSEAGLRRVPLHPDVMELGFARFLERRRRPGRTRIFYEIEYGADGQASSTFSKWFARSLDKVGLSDSSLVFHSFRHGLEDIFRDALAPQYLMDSVVGHAPGHVRGDYGEGVSLPVVAEVMAALPYPVSLPKFLAKRCHRKPPRMSKCSD